MVEKAPVEYFDRYSGEIRREKIYGERWLRWIYEKPLGRLMLWTLVRTSLFSKWYGYRMKTSASRARIEPFINEFGIDPEELEDSVSSFASFNDFFIRRLKSTARPICGGEKTAVFPADGRHLGFNDVSQLKLVFAKGQSFDLSRLFGSMEDAEPYKEGALLISRLCPVDYHRFHFPVSGNATKPTLINGWLYSVNPIALGRNLSILWENKRYLSFVDDKIFGRVASFEIGATCVGSVSYYGSLPRRVSKGEEKGWFNFGGSMTLTFFQKSRIRLSEDLLCHSKEGREIYAKMGDAMGRAP